MLTLAFATRELVKLININRNPVCDFQSSMFRTPQTITGDTTRDGGS
jgi:hypothetical protein